LVVDHYGLDISWEQALCKCVGNIFVIDDLADREHDCFALLDQNYGREPIDYDGLLPQDCLKLIGPKYALLRPEFLELRALSLQNRKDFKLETILINLGGVDQNDFTSKIVDALSRTKLDAAVKLIVVLGATNPNQLEVKQLASASPYNIKVKVGVNNMAELMSESDLAIGAAGSTTWERFALAVPSLLLSIADNQDSALTALAASGCIYKLSINTLQKDLEVFFDRVDVTSQLSALSKKGRDVCDALGVSHVERIIRKKCEG
jgi:UDP-2,4-diacetamido-2,4,6-trideoxy-beta-L-altropyranose hydrolase